MKNKTFMTICGVAAMLMLTVGCGPASELSLLGAAAQNYQYLDGEDGLNGKDGANGTDGLNGTNGTDGENGKDGDSADLLEIVAVASRDYDPSSFSPASEAAPQGVYSLPEIVDLVSGVAGTGWVTITVSDIKYCYQGNGRNNNDPGSEFIYRGAVTNTADECFNGSRTELPLELFKRDSSDIEVQVNGGGVNSSIRTATTVQVEILGLVVAD